MKNDIVISNFTGNVFQRAVLPERRVEAKSVSPEVSAFMNGTDVVEDGGASARMVSPYGQSSWVYIAVNRLAQKVSSIPFRISRIGGDQAKRVRALRGSSDPAHRSFVRRALGETIIESGAAVDLFNRPHPTMNRQLFWEMVVTWNCLRGEFFILPLDTADNPVDLSERAPRVSRLITVPTELFWHVVQGYDLMGWRYTGSPLLTPIPSEFLLPTEVIHSRSINPYLYWRGLSPLMLAMGPAGADFAASKYNQGYWLNNADTGLIVSGDAWPTPEQRATILAALRERKRKAGTPDRPLFLGGGIKVEKPTLSGMEQQFVENRKMNRQEIGAIYGVPDSIMGFSDAKSSSLSGGGGAIEQDGIAFIENTIDPLCAHIEAAVAPIVTSFGPDLIGWFDTDSLPVMQAARRSRVDTAVKAFALGATFNDVNAVYDLGFPKYPWGDKSFLPFNLQEITAAGFGANEPMPSEDPASTDPGNATDPTDEAKSNPFANLGRVLARIGNRKSEDINIKAPDVVQLWRKHILARRASVKLFQSKVGRVLLKAKARTLAKLNEVHLEKDAGRLQLPAEGRGLVDIIFSKQHFNDALWSELDPALRSVLQTAGDELNAEIGQNDPWEYPPKQVLEFLAGRKVKVQGCGETVRNRLNTTLEEGVTNGETHLQLAARVKEVFNDLTDSEAKRIAMTEVNVAYNDARHQAMDDAGIEYKAWLSSHGPNVREAHAIAETDYINDPIPLNEPFEVGGEQLMFPGDDSLGASLDNIINCQCIQLAAQKTAEDEKFLHYRIFGFPEQVKFAYPKK